MERIDTRLKDIVFLQPRVFEDHRGYFTETYSEKVFHDLGISDVFVQDNESFTARKGTLRGLHFQNEPMAQSKLVRVVHGAVMDVAVDLRRGSPTYLQWEAVELSDENKRMLYLPRGFAHGYLTLTDDVKFVYKVDRFYAPECDRSVYFADPAINVQWGISDPILSEKDRCAPLLRDSDCNFVYGG